MSPATNGTATSNAAAESMRGKTGQIRQQILDLIVSRRWVGVTADQIEQETEIGGNTVRPRLVELRELGLIKDSGHVRKTRSGRSAVVWVPA